MRENFPVERLYTRKAGSRSVSYVAPATKQYLLDDAAGSRLQVHAFCVCVGVLFFVNAVVQRALFDTTCMHSRAGMISSVKCSTERVAILPQATPPPPRLVVSDNISFGYEGVNAVVNRGLEH